MEPKYFFDKFALSEKEEMFVDMDEWYINICGHRYINVFVCGESKLWTNNFNVHIFYIYILYKWYWLNSKSDIVWINEL